jgi:hypothetical protein
VELCGTPEETRKGRQKLPKIRIKETAWCVNTEPSNKTFWESKVIAYFIKLVKCVNLEIWRYVMFVKSVCQLCKRTGDEWIVLFMLGYVIPWNGVRGHIHTILHMQC